MMRTVITSIARINTNSTRMPKSMFFRLATSPNLLDPSLAIVSLALGHMKSSPLSWVNDWEVIRVHMGFMGGLDGIKLKSMISHIPSYNTVRKNL